MTMMKKKQRKLMINVLSEIFYSPLELCILLTFGFALGSAFFLSLWWVVFKGLTSERPVLWFVGSFFIRIGLCLLGFYFISNGDWQSLIISLVGFILARPATRLLIELTSHSSLNKARGKDAS
jgi:F1F0 ATPase subunit 2